MSDDKIQRSSWHVYKGDAESKTQPFPPAPPWRRHDSAIVDYPTPSAAADRTFIPDASDIAMVNAALYLRRPLLVTGRPGSGKSSLASSIADDLGLGRVLVWPINSRSNLQDGLYQYDALARLQDASRLQSHRTGAHDDEKGHDVSIVPIGRYLRLGPLGTALLPRSRPRVLLIDEIDKSDIDLPNDLLHVFERGWFEIAELKRAARENERLSVTPADFDKEIVLESGDIQCREFPIVIMTSNGERDFPPAFNRRCLRLDMAPPNSERLRTIVEAHFSQAELIDGDKWRRGVNAMITRFLDLRDGKKELVATDQLLNALHMLRRNVDESSAGFQTVLDAVLRGLTTSGSSSGIT